MTSFPAGRGNFLRNLSQCDDLQVVRSSGNLDRKWNSVTQNGRLINMKSITANDLLGLPVAERLRLVEDLWDSIAEVPFNRKEHWGSDGRIKPDAPIYSPFIRHNEKLDLD